MLLNELIKPTAKQTKQQSASNLIKNASKQKAQVTKNLENKTKALNLPKDVGNGVILEALYIVDKGNSGIFLHVTKSTVANFGTGKSDTKSFSQSVTKSYCTSSEYEKIRNQGIGLEVSISGSNGNWVKSAANLMDCVKNGYL